MFSLKMCKMQVADSLEKSEKVKTGVQMSRMLAFYLEKRKEINK